MTTRKILRNGIILTGQVAKAAYTTTDKVGGHLFKWAITDHMGITQRIIDMPKMGFVDSLIYLGVTLVSGLFGALVAGGLTFIVIAYVIPLLLFGHL